MDIEKLKFPIGKLKLPEKITEEHLAEAVKILQLFPEQLKQLTCNVKKSDLDKPYRPEGWTIRQLIHHISDSHNHAYNRLRWTLTENKPVIKAYDQEAYAMMPDYKTAPIAWSISHIEIIHQKMVYILNSLTKEQWNRVYVHPETKAEVSLKEFSLNYAWHSMHHFAHIKNAL